ncbi:MAG: hypothetical protein OSB46_15555 [Alphaproteobacteria bacterium]|nr:hypothetical protein [Alphaproteobacteria bacterium]
MLNVSQHESMASWLRDVEGITLAAHEIIESLKTLDHYVSSWGELQERKVLDVDSPLLIRRGPEYAFWIAAFGDARGAAVF